MKTILKNSTGQVWTGNQVQSYMSFGVLYFKSERFKHAFEVHFEERKDLDLLIAQLESYRNLRDRIGQDAKPLEVERVPPKFVEAHNRLVGLRDRVASLEKKQTDLFQELVMAFSRIGKLEQSEAVKNLADSVDGLNRVVTRRLGELERKADVVVDVQALQEMLERWTAAQRLLLSKSKKTKSRGKKAKS